MADDGQIVAMLQSVGFPEYGPAFTAAGWTMSALKVSLQPRAPRPSSLVTRRMRASSCDPPAPPARRRASRRIS